MVSVRVSDITNPPPVQCSVLDPSVKQVYIYVMGTCLGCLVGDSVAVGEDEFRFGNIPAVLFVKGMKEVVR